MTANTNFERDLEGWLVAKAATTTPIGLHERAMDGARHRHQRSRWLVVVRGGTIDSTQSERRARWGAAYLVIAAAVALALIAAAIASGAIRIDPFKRPLAGNGRIAYSISDFQGPDQYQLLAHTHLMNADGTDDRAIAEAYCPRFSADGRALSYLTGWTPRFNTSRGELMVANADGSSPRFVPGVGEAEYVMSPDGTRIAWLKRLTDITLGDKFELWVAPVSGGAATRVVAATAEPFEFISFPVWSPDGSRIAFASSLVMNSSHESYLRTAIDVVDSDGTNLRTVTSRPGQSDIAITWSPDGRYLAYLGFPDGVPLPPRNNASAEGDYPPISVFVIGVDGTGDRSVTTPASSVGQLQWSPDGSHLAFANFDAGGPFLTTLAMNGPDPVGLPIRGPAMDGFTWSPDATRVLWHRNVVTELPDSTVSYQSQIRSADPDFHGAPVTLLDVPFRIDCAPAWQRIEGGAINP